MVQSEREPAEIEALFERAIALPIVDRAALLDGVRSRRPDVAREVESLLAAHDSDASILDEPLDLGALAEEEPVASPGTDLAGESIAGFRVVAPIGAGGMGTVYEAEQERPRRSVALKVLFDEGRSRERFDVEAQALARLDHPSIAKVYGAGTADGPRGPVSWMAFERIPDARTLTEYADERGFGLEERVRLMVPVCRAMHHAHRKGVLHRDLKPANILVSARGDGGPKLIDFGLARLFDAVDADEQLRTRRGELLGTLRYMSPEQCSGDPSLLDVRTDVYALGLVLFELLTGRLPYELEGRSLLQMLDVIRGDAPADPRALEPDVDDDLAAVLRRALEKDPEARFGSADEMADDLERWLAREPVVARRASWLHRARLFARRRRALFAGLAAGALAASVGITAIAALFIDNQLKDRAMDEARGELAGIASFLDDVVAQNADRVVERAAFERFDAATSEEQREAVLRAVEDLRRLGRLLEGEVGDVRGLARAFERVGDLLGNYWSASAADSHPGLAAFTEASALWRRVLAAQPDDGEARRALVSVLTRLADSSRRTGRIEEGRAAADEAVSIAREAVESSVGDARELEGLVRALFARGDLHIDQGPFEQGLVDTREAVRWVEELRARGHAPHRVDRLDSWTMLRLGHWLEREANDAEGGLAAHRRSRELRVAIVRHSVAELRRGERTAEQERDVQSDLVALYQAFTLNEVTVANRLGDRGALAPSLLELDDLFAELVGDVEVAEILPWATWYTALLLDHVDDEEERFLRRERVLWQWGELATRDDVDVEALRAQCLQQFSQTAAMGAEAAAVRDWIQDRGWTG